MALIGQFTFQRGAAFLTVALNDHFQWECPARPEFARMVSELFPAGPDDRGPQAGQPGAALIHRAAEHWGGVVLMLMAPAPAPEAVTF